MATPQQHEEAHHGEKQKRNSLNARRAVAANAGARRTTCSGASVLGLGELLPHILVGVDAAAIKVAHSYFLKADDNGNILQAIPTIARQY
jgi:hypothetical protein